MQLSSSPVRRIAVVGMVAISVAAVVLAGCGAHDSPVPGVDQVAESGLDQCEDDDPPDRLTAHPRGCSL